MTQLIETRWRRYGKDRVYVKTPEGDEVGHVDLLEKTVVAKIADYETELRACLGRWTGGAESVLEEPEPIAPAPPSIEAVDETEVPGMKPMTPESLPVDDYCRDLAANGAGAAARAKRNEINAQVMALR